MTSQFFSILRLQKSYLLPEIVFPRERSLRFDSKIIACTYFDLKFGEKNVVNHILFEISFLCAMHNVSGCAMLPDWTLCKEKRKKD